MSILFFSTYIGNPVVLSGAAYTIYADGSMIDNRISSGTATPTAYCASHLTLGWNRVNSNVIQARIYLEVTGITAAQEAIIATGFPKPRMGFDTPKSLTWWGKSKTSIIVYIDSQGNLHAVREEGAGSGNVSLEASFYYV